MGIAPVSSAIKALGANDGPRANGGEAKTKGHDGRRLAKGLAAPRGIAVKLWSRE